MLGLSTHRGVGQRIEKDEVARVTQGEPPRSTESHHCLYHADEVHGRAGASARFPPAESAARKIYMPLFLPARFISSIVGGRVYSDQQMSGQARNNGQDKQDIYHLGSDYDYKS